MAALEGGGDGTKPQHLTDAVAALDLKLSDEERQRLEAPYIPQLPTGLQ